MMSTKTTLMIAVGAAMLLTACNVDKAIKESSAKGNVSVVADWSRRGDGVNIPTGYAVRFDNKPKVLFTEGGVYPEFVEPGRHRLYAYNEVEGLTVEGNVIKWNVPTRTMESLAFRGPEWFFSSMVGLDVETKKEYVVTAAMEQRLREVKIILDPAGVSIGKATGVDAVLTGMAGSFDMDSGEHGNPMDIPISFTEITSGADAGRWSATLRTLGVVGGNQRLLGTVTYDGMPDGNLNFDLARDFAGFNRNKMTPLTIAAGWDGPGNGNGNGKGGLGVLPSRQMAFNVTPVQTISGSSTGGSWVEGDKIGIFAVEQGGSFAPGKVRHLDNLCLMYTGGEWVPAGPASWPENGATLDFYAYYPYNASVTDPTKITFRVEEDQSTDEAFHLSDMMTYQSSYAMGDTVAFAFEHALTMIQLTIEDPNQRFGSANLLTATLKQVQTQFPVSVSGSTSEVVMHREPDVAGTYLFRALIPAQTVTAGDVLCVVSDGTTQFEVKVSKNETFVPGTIWKLTIKYQ